MAWYKGRWLTVYHVQQAYGGPEEGGWWYNVGDRLETVNIKGFALGAERARLKRKYAWANDPRGLYSVISEGIIIVDGPTKRPGPEHKPETRPYYC